MFHEDLFDCISEYIKGAISKEMIKENVIVRAEDGGYLIPPINILKKHIEQELEAKVLVTKRLSPPRICQKKNQRIRKEGFNSRNARSPQKNETTYKNPKRKKSSQG
ncbi:hypothetical protein O181_079457 [Austropuccinia psidii MF-1]|uniref:Uncharacterized protein n=1 Tax=Austropuccinia psidii MF-1 TaxID=1389203 RepID=A0A9Q3IGJ2_9BASI|nr:hypothetical protein [Austropuccinia psidii MF-1]